jgi:hypothetical protein
MRLISALTLLWLAGAAIAQTPQGHDVQPPSALNAMSFMLGDWSGKQNFVTNGPPMSLKAVNHAHLAVGNRYIEERLTTYLGDGSPRDVRHFLTYDPNSSKYRAWWFNDSSVGAMVFTGEMQDGKLVMVSDPVMSASGTSHIFRATYEKVGDNGFAWSLEFQQDGVWTKQFRAEYTRD